MKKFLWLAALILCASSVRADNCPMSVKCSIDGQIMLQEQTYYDGIHKSVKYGHDYYEGGQKEHHYVIVSCD